MNNQLWTCTKSLPAENWRCSTYAGIGYFEVVIADKSEAVEVWRQQANKCHNICICILHTTTTATLVMGVGLTLIPRLSHAHRFVENGLAKEFSNVNGGPDVQKLLNLTAKFITTNHKPAIAVMVLKKDDNYLMFLSSVSCNCACPCDVFIFHWDWGNILKYQSKNTQECTSLSTCQPSCPDMIPCYARFLIKIHVPWFCTYGKLTICVKNNQRAGSVDHFRQQKMHKR